MTMEPERYVYSTDGYQICIKVSVLSETEPKR